METKQKTQLLLEVNEKPELIPGILLSFQHVFAMFGATILVPLILGMSVSTALLASGIGTLIYIAATKAQVPVYLGSSFAYISAMSIAKEAMGGDISAAQTGIMLVGLLYVIVAMVIKRTGSDWLNRLLPPIVIGPMIMVIGLGLAGTAVTNAGFVKEGDWRNVVAALVTFIIAITITVKGKGFLRVIPFLIAIIGGYLTAILLGIVDFTPVAKASWLAFPDISLPLTTGFSFAKEYKFYFGPEAFAILPIAIVTIAEHIGDHVVLGEITNRDYVKQPGLHRTLIGDGVATFVSALIGGPANTTYGENTGVIGMTRIASVSVIRNAALIAIVLSFFGKFTALISTIPNAVLGGMAILLYGVIASNGLKVLIKAKTNFAHSRNLIIASAMLVIGLGGAVLELGSVLTLSGTALSAIVGVVLNAVLPHEDQDNMDTGY
ncbi:uracil-xanthine permease family protein [Tuanshanicoccus lijuaniae]|uniref:uracil-xanthine permease family protein n=1 Tax=Aerococcaceae bacterium zg-1292 TaxID=2774330 RepID=UPI001BD81462|nr:NCS2 family nucleobase:cation symporter [Aerococcaceae bacterium zg-A91]MBS4458012.1 NCS2 family nucleobase:cation symporter [Aerococcaceae bacterium zg-BR33]